MAWERPRYESRTSKAEKYEEKTEDEREARNKSRREKREKGDWKGKRWVRKNGEVFVEKKYKKETKTQVDQGTLQLLFLFLCGS